MRLWLSRFTHLIPVAADRVLVIDAVSHVRVVVKRAFAELIESFAQGKETDASDEVSALLQAGILTDKAPQAELAAMAEALGAVHGRDPRALVEKLRRQAKEGGDPYWAVTEALDAEDFKGGGHPVQLLLLGECDVHMESDFLRRQAAARGIDLAVAATFPDDLRLAAEHAHDAILIGALRSRFGIAEEGGGHAAFIAEARGMLEGLRKLSAAPILIDALPEPSVQPLGMAEHGLAGHRNRFRRANLALVELAEEFRDVHVIDLAAAFAAAGAERMLDDGQTGFAHFGSPGWMLQRPEIEKAAVHDIFPDMAPLADMLGGDPYLREAVTARLHLDAIAVVLGLARKKCVIVDLDGVLWPGVLAETGSPFAWRPEVSGQYSFVGLFFGIHEALLALKKRGILLACVSKNDEALVQELWKYQDHYPLRRLLTPRDFVTWRVNWDDKVANIRAIADELGLALDSFLFIDDNPLERERVRQRLPEVEVWGEDLFGLRRRLLSDPRLQVPHITASAADRTELTRAQLARQAARQTARAASSSEEDFVASLEVEVRIERLAAGDDLERVCELFQRTTQFNTTGMKFTPAELEALLRLRGARVFAAHVRDRFADHGLVAAAVIRDGEILGLVMSCRVIGLGVEHKFLQDMLAGETGEITGRIIPTARNHPVRNLFADNGFSQSADGLWRRAGR